MLLSLFCWASWGAMVGLWILVLGLAGTALHLVWQLSRLYHWLRQPTTRRPIAPGAWGDVLYLLDQQISRRQETERRSAEDMEQLLEATRSLPDAMVILDKDDHILWLNDAAERDLGLYRARDQGAFVHYLLRNSKFVEWLTLEDFSRALMLASPPQPERTLSLRIMPMPRDQKMLIAQDVTEIERVEHIRRDFVANVSHELRTPITVIAGFLEAFDDMDITDPAEFKKHIHLMREQSDRIRRLLDDLLTLARLESDPELGNETVDIGELAEGLLREARSLSQGHHEITLQRLNDLRLIGNRQELESALGNLVVNAVRYTPQGGSISLSWRASDRGGAEFVVSDTGEGIEAKHIPRLTERFYRVDRGRSRATGGTGLGLAIVKHILQRHQGRLRIDSTVGKGSTFTALFPESRIIPADAPSGPQPAGS